LAEESTGGFPHTSILCSEGELEVTLAEGNRFGFREVGFVVPEGSKCEDHKEDSHEACGDSPRC